MHLCICSSFFYLEKKPVSQIHVVEMSIDRKIPFCEYFVIPYYLWFLYVAATVITFCFSGAEGLL